MQAAGSAEKAQIKDLMQIPGVGPSIARDLVGIGIKGVEDLKGRSPERLYAASNRARGVVQDPCLLYVFRCAVYFASTKRPSPEKLQWWYWKNHSPGSRRAIA